MGALKGAGVKVVAITAEPGNVVDRLLERKVPPLDFEVRSDPDHKFMDGAPDIFVTKDHDWDVSGPYRMIQPAVVVYDKEGAVIEECSWSWKTMGLEDGDWDTRVETEAWAGPTKKVMLVTMRPVLSDLVSAIQERRPVKLASTHDEW